MTLNRLRGRLPPLSSHLGSITEACDLAPRPWCSSESLTLSMWSRACLSGQPTRTLRAAGPQTGADAQPPRVSTRGPSGDAQSLPSEHGRRCPLRHKHTLACSFLKHAVWLCFSFFSHFLTFDRHRDTNRSLLLFITGKPEPPA